MLVISQGKIIGNRNNNVATTDVFVSSAAVALVYHLTQ